MILFGLLAVTALALGLLSANKQDPSHRRAIITFESDCNWLVSDLAGKIKVKSAKLGRGGFRAYHPYLQTGAEYTGLVIFRSIDLWLRDYLVMHNSAVVFDFANIPPQAPWRWWFVIHFNELGGHGFANAGAKMVVTGAARLVLYDGTATIQMGDAEPFKVVVREGDYANYPPWSTSL